NWSDPPLRRGLGFGGAVFVSAVTSILVSASTVWSLQRVARLGQKEKESRIQVPELRGLPTAAAEEVLSARGLRLVIGATEPDSKTPRGAVLAQRPMPNARVAKGEEVMVSVSSGPTEVRVPNVIGQKLDDARDEFSKAGIEVGQVLEAGEGSPGTVTAM